jgi:hypothetical protein
MADRRAGMITSGARLGGRFLLVVAVAIAVVVAAVWVSLSSPNPTQEPSFGRAQAQTLKNTELTAKRRCKPRYTRPCRRRGNETEGVAAANRRL